MTRKVYGIILQYDIIHKGNADYFRGVNDGIYTEI